MVAVLGALYSTLLHQEISDYLPYLAVGLVVWAYLASVANEGCMAFIGAGYLIKQHTTAIQLRQALREAVARFRSNPKDGRCGHPA